MIQVLMVEDDSAVVQAVGEFCAMHQIAVSGVPDASQLEQRMADENVDVLLLDVGLPGEDGFSICRRLRAQQPALPIMMVSGRADDLDRILGLELGADDYLTKPFVPRELVARIRALWRRSHQTAPAKEPSDPELLRFGHFMVDLRRRELSRDGVMVGLTNAEFDLLAVFCRNPGRALKRAEILAALRDQVGASERGIDVTVVRLRKLLEADPRTPTYIKTVWRVGYVFTP